jgi:hypothetical protein
MEKQPANMGLDDDYLLMERRKVIANGRKKD